MFLSYNIPMNYLPLHIHSGFTLLGSGLRIEDLISKINSENLPYYAISDLNSVSSYPHLYQKAVNNNKKVIYGLDLKIDDILFSCYIENEEGYSNVNQLLYKQSKGELNLETFLLHLKGLKIVVDLNESKARYFFESSRDEFIKYLDNLFDKMPSLNVGIPFIDSKEFIQTIREYAVKKNIPTLAFPFIKYNQPEDEIVLKIVTAIEAGTTLEETTSSGKEYFIEDAIALSYFTKEERENTFTFAEGFSFEFYQKRGGLVKYPNNKGMSSKDYLSYAVKAGLIKRVKNYDQRYINRLNYELSIINSMGYADYFLIVADYVSWAKKNGILVGPGRGSGAGSLVSYCLGIVSADPLSYGLMFERFLNPYRQSMPDIDVDFEDARRDEVVAYLISKYGIEHVSHIVTMQTLGARASLRDIGRVYNYEIRIIDLIVKTIKNPQLTLRENYKTNADFRKLVDSDSFYLNIVKLASKIEGLPRQTGLHAAGIILNDKPLQESLPMSLDPLVGMVSQFEFEYLEEQGFLKMDLLALINLSTIKQCLLYIQLNKGISLNFYEIPWDDKNAIKLIAQNSTMGLFQLESAGMNSAIKELKPTEFNDIVALLALYRPGPMANIPTYAKRKEGKEKISYIVPELEPILSDTYGIIVYQEQIIQIVQKIAGFDSAKSDTFRRAISKKDALKLDLLKEEFLKSAISNGYKFAVAQKIFDLIYKFADYGFNKSHSVSYAILSCQMAYLKYYYPVEFYCALLDSISLNDKKFELTLNEIKKQRIKLALPDINLASYHFISSNDEIIFPLTRIKGINSGFAISIIQERNNNGPYKDIFDFAKRNIKNGLTTELLVKLIDSGCFDKIDNRRASLRFVAEPTIEYAKTVTGDQGNELLLSLNFPTPTITEFEDNIVENLDYEKSNLGIMISGSPLSLKKEEIETLNLKSLADLDKTDEEIEVAAIVANKKVIITKNNKKMAFVTLYDDTYQIEGTMFSDLYSQSYILLGEGSLIRAKIKKDPRKENSYLINSINQL